jgi:hypothetical protein
VRTRQGLVGPVGCTDLAVGGEGAGSTLSHFALTPINAGNTSLNSSCLPQVVFLPGGQSYVVPGACSPPILPPTGIGAGLLCTNPMDVIINGVVQADGRLLSTMCSPVNMTSLNGSAVYGDLNGIWPFLFINVQPGVMPGCDDIGSYTLCLNSKGSPPVAIRPGC